MVIVIEFYFDNVYEDLRLDRLFFVFVKYCDSFNMDIMNKKVRVNKGLIGLK